MGQLPGQRTRVTRAAVAVALATALALSAILVVGVLQTAEDHGHQGVVELDALASAVSAQARRSPAAGGPSALASGAAPTIRAAFAQVNADDPSPALTAVGRALDRALATPSVASHAALTHALTRAEAAYSARAYQASRRAQFGTATAIGMLIVAFLIVYQRSVQTRAEAERLAEENARLASQSEEEALTDALTELGNRRALLARLAGVCESADTAPMMLTLFDLDGFKQYNDAFGHPAGDALLRRLGERLSRALPAGGGAYRMGGDEFCVVTPLAGDDAIAVAQDLAEALSDHGDRFAVSASLGIALCPAEAGTPEELLRIADQRMYANKATRSRNAASRQAIDVLEQVLAEQGPALATHGDEVAVLAGEVARRLGMTVTEVRHVELAARLHDIGKCAIPAAILDKPAPLDEDERRLMRQHTIIGERIVNAAPAISHVAPLIRASHERIDGTGYPDRLRGDQIPLGARIVTVCDAFHAMTSDRPYRPTRDVAGALAELQRCAGTQFDSAAVAACLAVVSGSSAQPGSGTAHDGEAA